MRHQLVQQLGRLVADLLGGVEYAGQGRVGQQAFEFVVVHAQQGDILGDAELQLAAHFRQGGAGTSFDANTAAGLASDVSQSRTCRSSCFQLDASGGRGRKSA